MVVRKPTYKNMVAKDFEGEALKETKFLEKSSVYSNTNLRETFDISLFGSSKKRRPGKIAHDIS